MEHKNEFLKGEKPIAKTSVQFLVKPSAVQSA